jgi:uncharacterized membrane protein
VPATAPTLSGMSTYELLLFLHVAFAILWLGSGFFLQLLALRADASRDSDRIKSLLDDADWASKRLFIPSSLAVLVLGVLLVLEGPWTFGELWIVLGLAGYAATFLTGSLVITPQVKRISKVVERDGGMSDAALAEVRRLFLISRVDLVVLFAVVAVMALKPTADDVGTLVVLAFAIAASAAYSIWRFCTSAAPNAAPAREPA